MADTASFISPARIKVLLVPIHPIKRAKFERYSDLIRNYGRIQLADVPADIRGERAAFSSSPTTPGALLFEYLTPTTYASSHPLAFLSEFQIHRRIHGIIGILDCSEYPPCASLSTALEGFQNSLVDLPKTFATKIYGFEPSDQHVEDVRKGLGEADGLLTIPGTGDIGFYLNTLLADFASEVLWDFSNMAAELESRTSIPTPQETSGPVNPFSYIAHRGTAKAAISRYASPAARSASTDQRPINLASLGIAAPMQSRTAQGLWGGSTSGNQDGFMYGMSIQSNMQVKAVPSPPPGAQLVDQKARKKVAGREKKLMADMWLLAGRLEEAISCYNEAIALTKGWQDQVWQASAMENLMVALVIQAWSPRTTRFEARTSVLPLNSPSGTPTTPPPPPIVPPDSSTFLTLIPERLSIAVTLYSRMLPILSDSEDPPPPDPDRTYPLIYAEACLRCARFLIAVWESGGWIEKALERLILPAPNLRVESLSAADQATAARLTSMSPSNTVTRSSIAIWVSMAYSPHLATLALPLRLRLTGEISSMFAKIGYRRKESFVLREIAALCGEGVAGKGIEVYSAESSSTKMVAANGNHSTSTIQEAASESTSAIKKESKAKSTPIDRSASIVRTTSNTAGNESIIRVAEKVCEAFGIKVVARVPKSQIGNKRESLIQGKAANDSDADASGHYGWQSLQVGVLRDSIMIAESLPDYQAAIRFTVTALRTLSDFIPPAEQYRLSQNIPRIFAAATRRGAAFDLEYWGPHQLLMSLEVSTLPSNRQPFEHPYQDVSANAKSTTAALAPRDPFIYNPNRGASTTKAKPTIVQNEVAEVYVTLRNPFLFDLEIQRIELSTSGVAFSGDSITTSIPPGSIHTIRLSGTALESGDLTIRGCHITLAGCVAREFVLPVWNDEDEAKLQKASLVDSDKDRAKASGLDSFLVTPMDSTVEEGLQYLECTVVPEMPLLWMRSTSLNHGALMLYDGEFSTIRIGLENTSNLAIDFVKLTFSDMLTTARQAYIADNELRPQEAYEIEADNLHRPVFTWKRNSTPFIKPGESFVLEIQCLGKVGCGSGTIQLDYALVDQAIVKTQRIFHTRQLFCDVFMTVHRALVPHSLDILRLKTLSDPASSCRDRSASITSLGRRGAAVEPKLGLSLRAANDGDHCLLTIDIKNAYGSPFEITLEQADEAVDDTNQRQRLEPGATARMLLRLDRLRLSPEALSQPIPSLTERQFVVSKTRQSSSDEQASRELFWYREELMRRIQARWNEVGSLRNGMISLRNLHLSKFMLEIVRADEVDISLHLEMSDQGNTVSRRSSTIGRSNLHTAKANDFMNICARVVNNTTSPLQLILRLELLSPEANSSPEALAHLLRFVVIDGLASTPLPILAPIESTEIKMSLCLLAEGQYEFGCFVEELSGLQSIGERKVYQAREPIIIVVDRS